MEAIALPLLVVLAAVLAVALVRRPAHKAGPDGHPSWYDALYEE